MQIDISTKVVVSLVVGIIVFWKQGEYQNEVSTDYFKLKILEIVPEARTAKKRKKIGVERRGQFYTLRYMHLIHLNHKMRWNMWRLWVLSVPSCYVKWGVLYVWWWKLLCIIWMILYTIISFISISQFIKLINHLYFLFRAC